MAVAGSARTRLIGTGWRGDAINADARRGKLGDRGQRRGHSRSAAARAEAGAGRIRVMRLARVVRALATARPLLHLMAVRTVLGAR